CVHTRPVAVTARIRQPGSNWHLERCCSSVVEHSLGKGEADSSILSSSTILHFPSKRPYCRPDASWKLAGRSVWSHSPFSACAAVRPVAAATPGFRSQETSKPQSRLREKEIFMHAFPPTLLAAFLVATPLVAQDVQLPEIVTQD